MSSQAFSAHGTKFAIGTGNGDAAAGPYTDVAECKEIPLPSLEIPEVEVTNQDSGGVREYIPGLKDGGTVEIECNYLDSTMTQLRAILGFNKVPFRITYPNGAVFTFKGHLMSLEATNPFEGEPGSISFGIKTTGDYTFVAGS